MAMDTVLLTGAAGGIGTRLRSLLRGVYPSLRLSARKELPDLQPDEDFVAADLADLSQVERAVEGVDGIIHMGGRSVEDSWEVIHEANIVGGYNLYEAARRQGVKRIIFASTNHTIGFYRRERQIDHQVLVRPDSRYGVSKAFGEALGALYADKYGLRVMCIRIGNVDDKPVDQRRMSIWLSPRDLVQLIRIGLEHPDVHYEVVYGASDNEPCWWDNSAALRLGYKPQDRSVDHREAAAAGQAKLEADSVGDLFQGGGFASAEFSGDLKRV